MKNLNEISQRIELRKKKLERGLAEIVKQIRKMGALKIVLFGSFVSGKITPSTDLDIFVVMPVTKKGKEWLDEIYGKIERYVACDIIVFNLTEYKQEKEKNLFLKEIEKKGKVIYEKRV
jgi:predicted nucleotidyltransferase